MNSVTKKNFIITGVRHGQYRKTRKRDTQNYL